MKKLIISLSALFMTMTAMAQECQSDELAYRVKSEAFSNSQINDLAEFMTDMLGSRLAASQMKQRADKLVVERLQKMGLSNPRVENVWTFEKGAWDVEKTYAAMTAPYYCAYTVNPVAWTGSTNGLVKGECVLLDVKTKEDLAKYKGKLGGKVVLMPAQQTYTISFEPLASRFTDEQLKQLENDRRAGVGGANRMRMGNIDMSAYMAMRELRREMTKMIQDEKALCVIQGSGSFNVPSATGGQYKVGDPEPTPMLLMPIEDHGRMCRLIQKGEKVEMELELKNKFSANQNISNVYAEIPGTDPKLKNEVVLLGGHLDSWHGSTGGADNASGCIVMMEAMRILKDLGVKPKRTIRLALWGGEEQGLYGSRGYAKKLYDEQKKKALPEYNNFALYLNMDNGSGRFRGIYLEQNDLAKPFFEAWKVPIESLGFTTLSPNTTGSTDHESFNTLGLPAYQFIQDALEYRRTYHTIMDTYERLSLEDLKIDAAITAWLAICAANDSGRIPVKPGYPEASKPLRY